MTTNEMLPRDPEERFYGLMGRMQETIHRAITEFLQAVGEKDPFPRMDDSRMLAILEISQPDQEFVSVTIPATVWDHFKQDYLPGALLALWPVKYVEKRMPVKPWMPMAEETLAKWRAYLAERSKDPPQSTPL